MISADGAHNPEAARALAATWAASPWSRRPGALDLGPDARQGPGGACSRPLAPFLRDVVAHVRPPSPRALEPLGVRRRPCADSRPRARVVVEEESRPPRSPPGVGDARAPAVAVCAGSPIWPGAALTALGEAPMSGLAVGVDVGGGRFAKIALVTPAGGRRPLGRRSRPSLAARRRSSSGTPAALKGWRYDSLGLGLAGGVDAESGALLFAPNLKRWKGFSFKREFERRLKVRPSPTTTPTSPSGEATRSA